MTGVVDITTGKIVGVKKGSLEWWHEKGHIVYHSSEQGIKKAYLQELSFQIAVTMVIWAFFVKPFIVLALVTIGIYWILYAYEEHWCWDYAKKMYKGGQSG